MKQYFAIALILFLVLTSCSNEEPKIQTASKPSVPVLVSEVLIGSQTWMTKNLDVSHYRNGDLIPQVTDQNQWANLTTGAWCYYANSTANGFIYGKLYNWYAVNDPRRLAPRGWHVPNDNEWLALTTYLGGESIAGGKMKSTSGWIVPNTGADNSSGFTALPGGYRSGFGPYDNGNLAANWWSSEYDSEKAWVRFVTYDARYVLRYNLAKDFGQSVRCIKD